MKQIKFDLPIDGTKVRNIEELRDHFSTEILDLYKNGLLVKWLINQRYPDYAQAVERLLPTETDANLLKLLCGIFEIDVDFEIIQQLADYHGNGIKIDPEQLQYKQQYEQNKQAIQSKGKIISFDDEFIGSSVDMETIIKMHKFHTGEDVILVPVILKSPAQAQEFADFHAPGFINFRKEYKFNKGNHITREANLLSEKYSAIAPCDGILYKKVFPSRDFRIHYIHGEYYDRSQNLIQFDVVAYLQVNT